MLIEVNCETDFVAKGDRFKELVADMAMQVCALCCRHFQGFAGWVSAPCQCVCWPGASFVVPVVQHSHGYTCAAQVAASPEASYVSAEDVSPEFVAKETAIEMEKEDILSKPEAIR